ncbi:MAG TPA: glycosyltransferase family 2 protein [Rhodopila sp.]|nr:glycosyltransferase family 2 protein [Rhodopila sp.]
MSVRHVAGASGPIATPYDADIIILTIGRTDETLAAIASATEQTGVTAHVFVLDQGTEAHGLARLQCAMASRPNVTLLAAQDNLGVAGGRNVLSGLGHGRVIIGLDNDATFAAPDTAARLVRALDAEPRLAAIGCRILTGCGSADDLSSWGYPARLRPLAAESFDAVTFVGAGHAIRRAAWAQVGGYDSALFFCWEEYDFCLRAIALGWRVRYRGDIEIRHAVSPERRVCWTTARWFYFVRNRLYIERKQNPSLLPRLPRICGYLLKGVHNGMARQTLRAIRAAANMPASSAAAMPAGPAQVYIARNDRGHRGSLLRRCFTEVFARPGAASAAGR